MTELKSSAEYETMLHAAQDKLKKQIEAKSVVADMAADLRREKIELKSKINSIDITISQYTQSIRQATETIQKLNIDIKQLTDAFWAAKKEGR